MIKTYETTCRTVYGIGALSTLHRELASLKTETVLCICDRGVKAAGILEKVTEILDGNQYEYFVFDEVQADPKDWTIEKVAEFGRKNKIDTVVGIGGGSSMDASKATALMLANPGSVRDFYVEKEKKVNRGVPLILIPTSAGTGSEATHMAVITDTSQNIKATILNPADIAIVDPELTLSVPADITASTGFDALAHAVEAYTCNSKYQNPFSDVLSLKAMKLIFSNIEKAYEVGSDLESRAALSLGSNFAGIAFSGACVHLGHCFAHEVGLKYHIAHGALCALALPEVIELAASKMPTRVREMASAMGIYVAVGCADYDAGRIVATILREKMRSCGIKSLLELGLSREQALSCAKGAIQNNWFAIAAPIDVTEECMKEFIGKIYDNYEK